MTSGPRFVLGRLATKAIHAFMWLAQPAGGPPRPAAISTCGVVRGREDYDVDFVEWRGGDHLKRGARVAASRVGCGLCRRVLEAYVRRAA